MTGENSALFQKTGTTRHFLFSKTDTSQLGANLRQRHESNKAALTAVFPEIRSGENFINHALGILASENKIGAMVIRVDDISPPVVVDEKQELSDLYLKVAESLDDFCQSQQGLWGLVDPCLFGCFVPGQNNLEMQTLANGFRNTAKKIDSVTVSIGTATYPTLNYKKDHILANAKKAIDHAAFFGPDNCVAFDAVSLNISGDQYYEKGDISGAIEEFQQALRIDASNLNVHNSLGVCYGVLGEYEKAIQSFQTVIESDDGEHMALYNLGFVHLLQGNREKALENFLKANQTYSDVFEIVLQTGKLYLDMDNPESGKNYLKQAAHLNPESGIVYRYLGDSYTALKSQDEAIIAYKKAVKYNPSDAASLSSLGCLFDEKGENSEIALMFCHESVKLAPENGLLRHRLGKLYLKQNQLENAFKEFRKAEFLGYDASQEINETQERIKAETDKAELATREAG